MSMEQLAAVIEAVLMFGALFLVCFAVSQIGAAVQRRRAKK